MIAHILAEYVRENGLWSFPTPTLVRYQTFKATYYDHVQYILALVGPRPDSAPAPERV